MVTFAISALVFFVTVFSIMPLLTTPEACLRAFAVCLAMTKSLTFKTTQRIWNKKLNFHLVKTHFDIGWKYWRSKS